MRLSMTTAVHPAPERHRAGVAALWFGLFGAPIAWSIQELVSYAVVAHACYPDWQPRLTRSLSGVWSIVLIVSLLTLLIGLAAGLTAYRSWALSREERGNMEHHPLEHGEGRTRFMALSGLILSSIFLLNLVMNAVVLFLVPACG